MNWIAVRKCIVDVFEIEERNSSIEAEVFAGYIHFITCLYVFPVVPAQLSDAGYDKVASIEATALACGVGCILSGYLTNLPFVIAPPTSVSIFLAVAMQQRGMNRMQGDAAVILSGCALLLVGLFKPLTSLVTKLIPDCIQASTAVGIGLITALAGAIELDLVVPGKYTIVEMGALSPAIVIAMLATLLIAFASHHKIKGAFMLGMVFGTLTWWMYSGQWPQQVMRVPEFWVDHSVSFDHFDLYLHANLLFLYILTLSGIARSMSDLAGLTRAGDASIPRGYWLFLMCGFATILSGYFSGPPILISPETAGGIKAGARTGLSTVVCGVLFLGTVFFCPLYSSVPPAGTSPLLILVGMTLFVNTARVRWNTPSEAIPAFFVLLLIPFTYSILSGVGFGFALYVGIQIVTGDFFERSRANLTGIWQRFRSQPLRACIGMVIELGWQCMKWLRLDDEDDDEDTSSVSDPQQQALLLFQLHPSSSDPDDQNSQVVHIGVPNTGILSGSEHSSSVASNRMDAEDEERAISSAFSARQRVGSLIDRGGVFV